MRDSSRWDLFFVGIGGLGILGFVGRSRLVYGVWCIVRGGGGSWTGEGW